MLYTLAFNVKYSDRALSVVKRGEVRGVTGPRRTTDAVDAHRYVSRERVQEQAARLVVVVADPTTLGRAVVPDRQVAGLPLPAHCVVEVCYAVLQELEERGGFRGAETDEAPYEVTQDQRALAGLRVDADHWVFGLEELGLELLVVLLELHIDTADPALVRVPGIVVDVAVHGPELVDQCLQRPRQIGVRRDRVGPRGRAAVRGQRDGPEQADRGDPIDEGHVGVPAVRLAVVGVDRQHVRGAVEALRGRVRERRRTQ